MLKQIAVLIVTVLISTLSYSDDLQSPKIHPCTQEKTPFSTEKSVVLAVECLYDGRVAKMQKVTNNNNWYYEVRVLVPGGRVKTVDISPEYGLPLDTTELEAVYEALNR